MTHSFPPRRSADLVVNAYWRSRPGMQGMADGVLLNAFIALSAAVTAALTLVVIRRIERKSWRGEPESETRWVPVPRSVLEEKTVLDEKTDRKRTRLNSSH